MINYGNDTENKFLTVVIPIAKKVMAKTGLPASVSVGQAIIETGYGIGELATKAFNFHGIKAGFWNDSATEWEQLPQAAFPEWTSRIIDIQDDEKYLSRFMVFDKIEDSFITHDRWFCYWEHYEPCFAYAKNAKHFLKCIASHYATDSSYYEKVWNVITKHNLTEIDVDVEVHLVNPWKEYHQQNVTNRSFKVAIMPGHGGSDSGAYNPKLKAREADYNWKEAQEIKRLLEQEDNYQVSICREEDEDPDLSDFQNRANATNADVCLCLHHNASDGNARGWWLFYTKHQLEDEKFIQIMDKHFQDLPLKARGYDYAGKPFSQTWFRRVYNCIGTCTKPTILIESCFIDNDEDCQWLMDGGYQEIARKICDGVKEYLKENVQPQSYPYQVVVNDKNPPLNVRSGCGPGYSLIGTLNNDTVLTVVDRIANEKQQYWLHTSFPIAGWVAEHLTVCK